MRSIYQIYKQSETSELTSHHAFFGHADSGPWRKEKKTWEFHVKIVLNRHVRIKNIFVSLHDLISAGHAKI